MSYHGLYRCRLCNGMLHGGGHSSRKNLSLLLIAAAEDRLMMETRISGAFCFERFIIHKDCDNGRDGLCDLVGSAPDKELE